MSVLDEAIILNNGSLMPKLGLNIQSGNDLSEPLRLGYRLFSLKDEETDKFKQAVQENHILFQQIFMQLNLKQDLKAEEISSYINSKLKDLGASHFDLVVLSASDDDDQNVANWQVLEKLKEQGRIKSLGVADFYLDNLQALLKKATIKPVLDYINVADPQLVNFLNDNHILLEQEVTTEDSSDIDKIAQSKKVSPEQVLLKYNLREHKITLIDVDDNLKANANLDFELDNKQQQEVAAAVASN